jgi:hypothetical protein
MIAILGTGTSDLAGQATIEDNKEIIANRLGAKGAKFA